MMPDEREKLLLRLLFSEQGPSEKEAAVLLQGTEPDAERMEILLMLAILGVRTGWTHFPDDLRPRLEGIYKRMRVLNVVNVPWLKEQTSVLIKAGIPVMFLKGMAMRVRYAPGVPRQMNDFDLAVPEERFEEAVGLLLQQKGNRQAEENSMHATGIVSGRGNIDLHRWIFKLDPEASRKVRERAESAVFEGSEISVPCAEDMFIHIVENKSSDILKGSQPDRKIKWLMDARCVAEAGTDWESVSRRAKELGAFYAMQDLMPVFSEVFPDVLPKEDLERFFARDDAYLAKKERLEPFREMNERLRGKLRPQNGRYSLGQVLTAVRKAWKGYRLYYREELKAAGQDNGFLDYVCKAHHTKSVGELVNKYILHR